MRGYPPWPWVYVMTWHGCEQRVIILGPNNRVPLVGIYKFQRARVNLSAALITWRRQFVIREASSGQPYLNIRMRFELALASAAVIGVTASPLYGRQSSEPVQFFNFTSGIPFENSFLRSETQLLATTLSSNNLYSLNPLAASPEAEVVAVLPDVTTITGLVGSAAGKVVVLGGVKGNTTFGYEDQTVFTVDFGSDSSCSRKRAEPTITAVAKLPDAVLLNGVAALPAHPEVVLITDSIQYCIWRVDTTTGAVDKLITDEALSSPANAALPLGANGLKIYDGHAYFTNTGAGIFARVPITEDGEQDGDVEILATVPLDVNYDDFAISNEGVAYLSQSPGAVVRVVPGGAAEFVIGADGDTTLTGPTSITLPKGGKKAYVTTRGVTASGISGQVFEISI
ncbi:hypothetical protein F4678DRAFT_427443 [Xylaria arbuscula]|nr:hypothetical protein F4678DRAFT_427443 [Xylaria arbuscula]